MADHDHTATLHLFSDGRRVLSVPAAWPVERVRDIARDLHHAAPDTWLLALPPGSQVVTHDEPLGPLADIAVGHQPLRQLVGHQEGCDGGPSCRCFRAG